MVGKYSSDKHRDCISISVSLAERKYVHSRLYAMRQCRRKEVEGEVRQGGGRRVQWGRGGRVPALGKASTVCILMYSLIGGHDLAMTLRRSETLPRGMWRYGIQERPIEYKRRHRWARGRGAPRFLLKETRRQRAQEAGCPGYSADEGEVDAYT